VQKLWHFGGKGPSGAIVPGLMIASDARNLQCPRDLLPSLGAHHDQFTEQAAWHQ
jgi:hypothetical protein